VEKHTIDGKFWTLVGGSYQPFSKNKTVKFSDIILTIILTGRNFNSYLPQVHQHWHELYNHWSHFSTSQLGSNLSSLRKTIKLHLQPEAKPFFLHFLSKLEKV